MLRVLFLAALLLDLPLAAQDFRTVILAASRSGVVELIDPSTLEPVARIHLDFPAQNAGLNGISAGADGATLFIDGPMASDPRGCCDLYALDLATLETKVVASVYGSTSRGRLVSSQGRTYPAAALVVKGIPRDAASDRFHLSPDGRWLFGVRSFRGPALDVFDLTAAQFARQLAPEGLTGDWWPSGVWSGDRFYLYAANADGKSEGRLWTVPPDSTKLDVGVPVAPFPRIPECPGHSSIAIAAAAGNLYLYEEFGFKVDRRNGCKTPIPGGAWIIDPATGQLTRQIAPGLHISWLVSDQTALYALSPGSPNWDFPQLVRIDPADGSIQKSRHLGTGFWRVAIAPLRTLPSGDVYARRK